MQHRNRHSAQPAQCRLAAIALRATFAAPLALCAALALTSCSTFGHASSTGHVAGRSLSISAPEGAGRLALEKQYDSAVREIVTKMGEPDWIHVVSRDQLYLYFTSRDEMVMIRRPMLPPGQVRHYEQIPGFLLNLLPKPVMDQVLAQRKNQKHAADTASHKRRSTRSRRHRSAPAASAPSAADALLDFEPDRIVRRLRTPLSAADPGVNDWRNGQLSDGIDAMIAILGTSRYVVRNDSVSVSASIAPRRRAISPRARHAFHRINRAVFGTRTGAVDQRVEPLIARVAADTSGRTQIRRRVAGRTVRVHRDTDRGLIIYSVHPK